MDSKTIVFNKFSKLSREYDKALKEIESLDFNHKLSYAIQLKYKTEIKSLLKGVIQEVQLLKTQIVWDHLVIAFFGETGAGKSTIIETLRLKYSDNPNWVHGEIVGDGSSDFTKQSAEYTLEIEGNKVTLIDVPGIEGNESQYVSIIKEALRKAHIVFYVQGRNRKPDVKIAKKIGDYLSDWTRVYSIHNIRGGVENYELEENLDTVISPETKEISAEIEESFKSILGDLYLGNISLQGLIALASSGRFKDREDYFKHSQRIQKLFKNFDNATSFSNFKSLRDQIVDCNSNYSEIIKESGLQKAEGLKIKGQSILGKIANTHVNEIDQLRKKLNEIIRKIKITFSSFPTRIQYNVNLEIEKGFSDLKSELIEIINKKISSKDRQNFIEHKLKNFAGAMERKLSKVINKEIKRVEVEISTYLTEFENISKNLSHFNNIQVDNIDFSKKDVLRHLEINIDDVVDVGSMMVSGAAIGMALGQLFGAAAGAVVGGVVGIAKKFIFGDGGKGEAIQNITEQIKVCCAECKQSISPVIKKISKEISDKGENLVAKLQEEVGKLNTLEEEFESLVRKIRY